MNGYTHRHILKQNVISSTLVSTSGNVILWVTLPSFLNYRCFDQVVKNSDSEPNSGLESQLLSCPLSCRALSLESTVFISFSIDMITVPIPSGVRIKCALHPNAYQGAHSEHSRGISCPYVFPIAAFVYAELCSRSSKSKTTGLDHILSLNQLHRSGYSPAPGSFPHCHSLSSLLSNSINFLSPSPRSCWVTFVASISTAHLTLPPVRLGDASKAL